MLRGLRNVIRLDSPAFSYHHYSIDVSVSVFFFLTAELTERSDDRTLTKPFYVPGWLIGSILSLLAFDVTFILSSLSTP